MQRKFPRFKYNNNGFYYYNSIWEPCHIFDLNLEGIGISLKENIEIKTEISVKIILNDEEKIFISEIVYCKNNRAGLIFKKIKKEDLVFLKKVINIHSDRFKI